VVSIKGATNYFNEKVREESNEEIILINIKKIGEV
jgi:hypothetical protein